MNRRKKRWVKRFKTWHKWPAITVCVLAFLFAFSGVVMNHRTLFSPFDVNRKYLPSNYAYQNWNMDAVKGSLNLSSDSVLLYGKIGVYLSNSSLDTFSDFNQGFEIGADNKVISAVVKKDNYLMAGTLMGLYLRLKANSNWVKIKLPVKNQRVTDLSIKEDTLLVLTRDYLLKTNDLSVFEVIKLPQPDGYQKNTSAFKFLWTLHSGEMFGLIGKLFVDLLGIVVVFLSLSGLIHFFFPGFIRRFKGDKTQLKNAKKVNLSLHNKIGYFFVLFLLVNTIAGMFLRPPLLIPIAKSKVSIIPYTHLDSSNPWQDKLRKVRWNSHTSQYIISTSEGFYKCDESIKTLQTIDSQPPVSVMGCNVLEQVDDYTYLVGSFSGLFSWNINSGSIFDMSTRKPYQPAANLGKPISANMVSGLVRSGHSIWYSDYNKGMTNVITQKSFPEMPVAIIDHSPISLWNLSLEIHTGRIFESILDPFYILYIPLSGICVLLVLVSGFFLWYWIYRK
ncbi:PepSY domain-containing protein [Labilibacter sediminis]|nr:PepSY domain-containing protein [Labilibacter sediminis]